ncbi:hypothetical protein [Desulfovibrio sp. Fe33]|uniref:hypothetical protein n=1 Tax=Desulfovibrio sp. Fe33 TaxID=3020842 RepID=UPI00234D681C|nr:hypothetical protein [Desulfovibrio sp. Fe33]
MGTRKSNPCLQHSHGPGKKADPFGFMVREKIRGKIQLDKQTAVSIRGRKRSDDQEIQEFKNGNLVLHFTARNMPEKVSLGAWFRSSEPMCGGISRAGSVHVRFRNNNMCCQIFGLFFIQIIT